MLADVARGGVTLQLCRTTKGEEGGRVTASPATTPACRPRPSPPEMRLHDAQTAHVGNIDFEGRRLTVSVRTAFDGVEYVGRLWFIEDEWDDAGMPDRGMLPGRTRDEVIQLARRLSPQELILRYRRALYDKRRFVGLRRLTDDILAKIRYLNQVAISVRSGVLDGEGAAQEIELTERQLHELVGRVRDFAGVEDPG
jgi:hypothetical protein